MKHEGIEKAFEAALRSTPCPACREPYTDSAVRWCNGWMEGRRNLMEEIGGDERDGPVYIRCEWCGVKANFNIFTKVAIALREDK